MRPPSLTLYAMFFFLPVFFLPANAETQVFQDAVFPYRISCKSEWTQEVKNDSTFQLKTTVTNKKTRFQLKKYLLDSNDTKELMRWSRINFAVNREIAGKLGTVVSSDSGINKKVGELRAFELIALYLQMAAGGDSVWWGELSRWTEYRGYGYYIAVIGDTADIVKNRTAYKTLLDSVTITAGTTISISKSGGSQKFTLPGSTPFAGALHDLLGRKFVWSGSGSTQLQVQRYRKRPIIFEPGGR